MCSEGVVRTLLLLLYLRCIGFVPSPWCQTHKKCAKKALYFSNSRYIRTCGGGTTRKLVIGNHETSFFINDELGHKIRIALCRRHTDYYKVGCVIAICQIDKIVRMRLTWRSSHPKGLNHRRDTKSCVRFLLRSGTWAYILTLSQVLHRPLNSTQNFYSSSKKQILFQSIAKILGPKKILPPPLKCLILNFSAKTNFIRFLKNQILNLLF